MHYIQVPVALAYLIVLLYCIDIFFIKFHVYMFIDVWLTNFLHFNAVYRLWQLIGRNDQKKLATCMHLREPIKNGRFKQ
jgi:hypothetical protein